MKGKELKTGDKIYWTIKKHGYAKTRKGRVVSVAGSIAVVRTKTSTEMVNVRDIKRAQLNRQEKLERYDEVVGALRYIVRVLTDHPKKNPFGEEYTNHLKSLLK